jgi:HAD superfamily hydrolase (TIGR01459 family)
VTSPTTARQLIETYDTILLDAYGVLVDAGGALPGAGELIAAIRAAGRQLFIVTNDASRLPETVAARFARFGIPVGASEVVTSGSLIAPYYAEAGLAGARTCVLGTEDSHEYVRAAGGEVLPLSGDADIEVLVVCDDSGFPFLDGIEAALSALYRRIDRGGAVTLVLPNPDLVYPKSGGEFGFTAGAMALLLEAGLRRRYGVRAPGFAALGKPHPPMFEEARRRAGSGRLVMVGDQLETDIAGARAAGIDAALLSAGVSVWRDGETPAALAPTYLLRSLAL